MLHCKLFLSVITAVVVMLAASSALRAQGPAMGKTDVLRDYVKRSDSAYGWNIVRKRQTNGITAYVIQLTSQRWRTKADVNRPVWKHWLLVAQPENVEFDTAFLMIGGGSNRGRTPVGPSETIARLAARTKSVVAELKMVPNQPLIFHGDGVPRKEDDLIGYAWNQFLETGDVTWLPRLPMVKSAVRAMDCLQELMAARGPADVTVNGFVVGGASKRGWTTWMTAVADDRVQAIVPIVIDVLNVDPSMRHHAEVYGFWTEAIGNYVQHGITKRWNDPAMDQLYAVVDPYLHRQHLTMPKFVVNACGDEFFCPDSSRFYFGDLPGEKHLRYVPNAGHSLEGTDVMESIAAFYLGVLKEHPRPRFTWSFTPDGAIRVETKDPPQRVLLWQATNPSARDFRITTIGRAFSSRELADQGDGVYVGQVEPPEQGWKAYLVELTYAPSTAPPLKLTTAARITPDTLPHDGIVPSKVPYERKQP